MGELAINGIRTNVSVGALSFPRCPHVWVESVRHASLTRGGITLPDPAGEVFRTIAEGDAVSVSFGYRDQAPAEWAGSVAWIRPGTEDQVEVGVVGEDLPLVETLVRQAWVEEAPETIIRHAVQRTGLPVGRIDAPGCVLPRFSAASIPAWQVALQVAHSCQRSFGLDMRRWALWLGADGTVNFGDFDEPGEVPVVATGGLLIRHSPATDASALSEVETWLLPGLRHSMLFRLQDARRGVDGEFRALFVRHEITDTSARTYVRYGEEHGRF